MRRPNQRGPREDSGNCSSSSSSSSMADIEVLINLFDFYWFESEILDNETAPVFSNRVLGGRNDDGGDGKLEHSPLMKLSQTPSFLVRSFSDQGLSSLDLAASSDSNSNSSSSPSPKSVLNVPKLETIYSGKEVGEFPVKSEVPAVDSMKKDGGVSYSEGRRMKNRGKRRGINGGGSSRSLSELEFEELKGFMDLGFVFSDEDKDDSSLVSILPGLQRLGKQKTSGDDANHELQNRGGSCSVEQSAVPRPYLSEAWEVLEKEKEAQRLKKKDQLLMNLKISATGTNDLDIKNQIKFWAHTVASTVR